MAKKKKKASEKLASAAAKSTLPQNIVSFGEHVVEDKNIYISQSVYKEIHKFTRDKTENESGGVLVGEVIEEFGKTNILIHGFIEARHSEGTPTTLKFTHKTWDYIHREADKKYPKYTILGWIHTHPDFGIFLSEYDKFIQDNFFKEENQIAYVIDPIQGIEGFYFWINGKLERCKGFFVFEKNGKKLSVSEEKENTHAEERKASGSSLMLKCLVGVLTAAVIVMFTMCLSLSAKLDKLEDEVEALNAQVQYDSQMLSIFENAFGFLGLNPAPSENPDAGSEGGEGSLIITPDSGSSVPGPVETEQP